MISQDPFQTSVEEFLLEAFEDNFQHLKLESGHTISPALKEMAWLQVNLYWQKLKAIAEKVTETEVKLTLPEQSTPENRRYTMEGVVDIVKEDGKVTMYDLKTHEAEQVRAHKDLYARQLNVYAHIWQNLRGQQLDSIAIISTAVPKALREALESGDPDSISSEMEKWEPVVPLNFDQSAVDECINDFGKTVDRIEGSKFKPPTKDQLKEKIPGHNTTFGVSMCRYCDGRFSCDSYRDFVKDSLRKKKSSLKGYAAMKYYLDDYGDESDREEWLEALFNAQQELEE